MVTPRPDWTPVAAVAAVAAVARRQQLGLKNNGGVGGTKIETRM